MLVCNPFGTDITPWMEHAYLGLGPLLRGSLPAMYDHFEVMPYANTSGVANDNHLTDLLHTRMTTNRGVGEQFIVFAYSQGCAGAQGWLQDHGPSLPIDPADLKFRFIGNGERKHGGFVYQRATFATVADIRGTPPDTDYEVWDLAREFDPICDFPTSPAINRALDGLAPVTPGPGVYNNTLKAVMSVLSNQNESLTAQNAMQGALWVHNFYFDVSFTDDNLLVHDEDNIKYLLSPTRPVPYLQNLAWLPWWLIESQDTPVRAKINKCYDRTGVFTVPPQPRTWLGKVTSSWTAPKVSPAKPKPKP